MENSPKSHRTAASRPVIATAAALTLMGMPVLTACGSLDSDDDTTQNVYCVDYQGNVIDPDNCDDDNGYYYGGSPTYLWITSVHHDVGYHVPRDARSGGNYFRADNTTARQNAGLQPHGRAPSTVRRSGGFGRTGGSGSNSGRGGSGGHSSSHGFGGGGHSSGG